MSFHRPLSRRRVVSACGVAAATLLAGAACSDTLQGTLALVTGPDDAFQQDPKPTSLRIQLVNSADGGIQTFASIHLPADGGLNLPPQSGTDVDSLRITAFDDAGDAVALGQTVPIELDELSGLTLNVFVQRTGQFSRLPEAGITTTSPPVMTTLFARYLLVAESEAGADAGATFLYDTLTWQTVEAPPLNIPPRSLVYLDNFTGTDASVEAGATGISALLSIGKKTAAWLDLTDSTGADAEVYIDAGAPSGGSFADVAGGATVFNSTTGDYYVVGPTRPSPPSSSVLRISPTGVMSILHLNTPRAGAAATYVANGFGLIVFGGAMGKAPDGGGFGAEAFADMATAGTVGTPLECIPFDPTIGAAAVPVGGKSGQQVLLAGGVTPKGAPVDVRLFDGASCPPGGTTSGFVKPWLGPQVTFTETQGFGLPESDGTVHAVIVGSEANGAVSAFELGPDGPATALSFRRPHTLARAIVLPTGALAVVGGKATMESYIP